MNNGSSSYSAVIEFQSPNIVQLFLNHFGISFKTRLFTTSLTSHAIMTPFSGQKILIWRLLSSPGYFPWTAVATLAEYKSFSPLNFALYADIVSPLYVFVLDFSKHGHGCPVEQHRRNGQVEVQACGAAHQLWSLNSLKMDFYCQYACFEATLGPETHLRQQCLENNIWHMGV